MADVTIDDKELADLKKQAAAGVKATALAEALRGELDTAKAAAAKLPELETQLQTFKAAAVDATFKGAGIEDAKVRRVFQLEFDEQAAADGGEKDLGAWLGKLGTMKPEERPAHLAPFIKAPAGNGAGGAGGGAGAGGAGNAGAGGKGTGGKLPDANAGAKGVEGAPEQLTAEQIEKMSPTEFAANWSRIQALIPGTAPFSIPPGFQPKA